jgi:hypothetical protein
LLDQIPVSLEYIVVTSAKADFRSQIVQCTVAHSTSHWPLTVLGHKEPNAILYQVMFVEAEERHSGLLICWTFAARLACSTNLSRRR